MSKALEDILRSSMQLLGRGIEAVIGQARTARAQVASRGGVQPVLAIENQLSASRLKEVIESAVQNVLANSLPDMAGQLALEIGEGPVHYGSRFLAQRAKLAVGVEVGGGSVGRQGDVSRGFIVRGSATRLPFPSGKFSFVLARLASVFQGDVVRTLREMGRVLARGGQGIIIDYHPYGNYATRGSGRLRPVESEVKRIEDYYRLCKQAGLRVVDVREVFIDETLRQQFREGEVHAYRNLKSTPLIILLFVYKPKGA